MPVKVTPKLETIVKEESPPVEFIDFEVAHEFKIVEAEPTPPFPAKTIRSDKDYLFFDWVAKLKDEDWNHLQVYLYREWPWIDRQKVNKDAAINIDKLPRSFTKDDIKVRHGSGKYKILVNDVNKAVNGKGGSIGTAHFEINEPSFPPVVRLDELVTSHPSNREYVDKLVAEGKLDAQGQIMTQQGGNDNAALIGLLTRMIENQTRQAQQQTPKDSTTESISKMFVDANSTMLGMVKDQIKTDGPDKLLVMLQALKEMIPKPENGNNQLELIVKMQSDMQKVQAESQAARETLMLKMMEMMNSKPDSGDAEDKVLSRIATYKELFGGEGGGSSRKQSMPELLIEHGAPVVLKVLETIQGVLSMKNYTAGLQKQQQQNGTQQPPATVPQAGLPAASEAPVNEKVVEMPQAPENELVSLIKGMAGPLILGVLQRGESGDNFAASLEGMYGKIVYDKIAALGKDPILAAMQQVPEFWNAIVPSSIEKFVEEFIAYGNDEPETEA